MVGLLFRACAARQKEFKLQSVLQQYDHIASIHHPRCTLCKSVPLIQQRLGNVRHAANRVFERNRAPILAKMKLAKSVNHIDRMQGDDVR